MAAAATTTKTDTKAEGSAAEEVVKDSTYYKNNECRRFDKMGIPRSLLKGIFAYGFNKPSDVQAVGIIPMIDGREVIIQAQSGTGKTGAFLTGMLSRITERKSVTRKPHALVISPSRELAEQTNEVCNGFTQFMDDHKTTLLIGGTSTQDNMNALDAGNQIAIGCPGRIYDMMSRGYFQTDELDVLVIDEADEMLRLGFKEQIREILKFVKPHTQICLFSATMPHEAIEISKLFMKDPIKILIEAEQTTLDGIEQYYLAVKDESWKFMALNDLFEKLKMSACFIYCNSKRKAEFLREQLISNHHITECIHGKMPYGERRDIMQKFRRGNIKVLISTDLTARGIDVQQVYTVVNYDIPRDKETYIHRIGRSGRYGRKGVAINFVNEDEIPMMQEIEGFYKTTIEPLPSDIKSQYDSRIKKIT